ncbi:MAG: hypothetical protein K2H43_06405, partial [Clostridia bacterium]|nr:hypothetical protein [Clostridia bacterium]
TQTALPSEIRYNGYFLDGFVFDATDAEEHAKTFIPDMLYESVTMYAKWSEIKYQITFSAEGVHVAVQNYGEGDALKNLPAVPKKIGYNGIWQIAEGYTVRGDDIIVAVYTAIVYEVSVYSDFALEGFAACEKGYVRIYSYEYDNAQQALDLPSTYKISGYDFGGYYTEPNGRGNCVERIDNGIVDTEELYLFWKDNTVTVTLYSDVQFAGSKWDLKANAYSATRSFNDVYTIGDEPKTEKFQQLGWWYQVSENEWRFVDDVRDYNGKALWAIWIQNLTVNLTQLSPENPQATSTYTIRGEVTGGAPYGKGKEIFTAVGASEAVTGKYYIYFSETKYDELNFGKVFTVNYDKDGDGYIWLLYASPSPR